MDPASSLGWPSMNRRKNSTLLLPFMAILALFYPVAFSPRQASPSAGTESNVVPRVVQQKGEVAATQSQAVINPVTQPPHDAKKILSEFVGAYPNDQQLYRYPLESQ